jgi:hypothetical protein
MVQFAEGMRITRIDLMIFFILIHRTDKAPCECHDYKLRLGTATVNFHLNKAECGSGHSNYLII